MLTKYDKETLKLVTEAAIKGELCPEKVRLVRLAKAGLLRVEVYLAGDSYMSERTTYRVVTILSGPDAGKETKRDASISIRSEPVQVLDARPTKELHKLGLIAPSDKRPAAQRAKVTIKMPDWDALNK